MENIYIFTTIALFVLIIAVSNFINLVLADSANRAKEVGIRKVYGARRKSLVYQFLGESAILCFISLGISVFLVEILTPHFGNLVDRRLTLSFTGNAGLLVSLVNLTVLISIIAGIYPALSLSKFSRLEDLRIQGTRLRPRGLKIASVVTQLIIASFLITCLLIMHRQVTYLKKKDLGFDPEKLVVFYKVMGAATRDIILHMIGDLGRFVLPAIVISLPLARMVISYWMQNFAYRTDIPFWIYLVSAAIALLVSLIAILIRVIRFALANPADSLRSE